MRLTRQNRTVASDMPRVGIVRGLPHTYEVQDFTGAPVANNPAGRWNRGELVRTTQPAFVGPAAIGYYAWDPTDPNGWVNPSCTGGV